MELDPLQRLFEPLLPRQPHLLFLILGYLPRLKKQLRVIQRPQLFDPILDVFAFRVVIMCLFEQENIISIAQVKQQWEAIQEKRKQGKRFGCVKIYLKRRKRKKKKKKETHLLHRIKHPCLPRVIPHPGIILPIAPITTQIIIAQQALIPLGPNTPIDAQMFRQERRYVLPESITRVAR